MADKNYNLIFTLSDGTKKCVQFTAPQGEKGDSASGCSKTVLWQNDDPSDRFSSSKTIALPIGDYDAVEIIYMKSYVETVGYFATTGELPVWEGMTTKATLDADPEEPAAASITTSEITFTLVDRTCNIPYLIYGIKRGNSTGGNGGGEVSYTNVLDSVGYETNKAIMSGDEEDNTGTDLTGFIEVAGGDVIRLKNVTMPDVEGYENRVYCYRWNKDLCDVLNMTSSNTANSPVFKNGNLVQFTILDTDIREYIGDTGWIRIGAANIDSKSVITINENIN